MTGLRPSEPASLTPGSFDLDKTPPTVTVAAPVSKHRRTDASPLHPDLVVMLREWLEEFGTDEPLFPKPAQRGTWLMVKKDLERAGIPYFTPSGVADFHAAGRHAYITELLRNGASLPEARELARHSGIKVTMRYTHIGINDQARTLAAVPNPCQYIVSNSAVSEGREAAGDDADSQSEGAGEENRSPEAASPSDTKKEEGAPDDSGTPNWRRRESNPRPVTFRHQLLRA